MIGPLVVKTGSGTEYSLQGPLQEEQAIAVGVPEALAKIFRKGFPKNWKAVLADLQRTIDNAKIPEKRTRRKPTRFGTEIMDLSISSDEDSAWEKEPGEEGEGSDDFDEITRRKKQKVELEDEDGWMLTEITALGRALGRVDPTGLDYWEAVAQLECQVKHESQLRANTVPENKAAPVLKEVTTIRGKVGTISRKQDLRRLLQFTEQGHNGFSRINQTDDYLCSTPAQQRLRSIRPFDIDSPCLPDFGPMTPVAAALQAVESPELLKPVNRDDLDGYINKIKGITRAANREKKKESKAALRELNRPVLAESPATLAHSVARLTKSQHKRRPLEDDGEEAEAYYFSESESDSF